MKFGVMLAPNPPWERLVERAKMAERLGFDYVWLPDSGLHRHSCWPLFALVARETERVKIGVSVTYPATRDVAETAAMLATLDEISGGRMVCGIGRGDAAPRMIGLKPASVQQMEEAARSIRELVEGREIRHNGVAVRIKWATGYPLEVWGAGYGPKALAAIGRSCDGFMLQLADPLIFQWTLALVREGARAAGRDPAKIRALVLAPAYVTQGDAAHAHDQLRYFGAVVGNHVAELVRRQGAGTLPPELTAFASGRAGDDYSQHGTPGDASANYVSDDVNLRFSVMGTVEDHITKLRRLSELGAEQFALSIHHDQAERTLEAYGREIIPALRSP